MKPIVRVLCGGLLASATVQGRNPEPLRLSERPVTIANPVGRVVLVHGFLDTGDSFRHLRRRLEKRRLDCLVPDLRPNDGRGGLEHLAEQLKGEIDSKFGPKAPISIVGFSMGGLVCRHYLQQLGGARRCETFVSISSPHRGTWNAWLYPSKGASQMRPGSRFLQQLAQSEHQLDGLRLVSLRTPLDLMILPADSSVWDRAENRSHVVALHPMMLTSNRVLDDIESRLLPGDR